MLIRAAYEFARALRVPWLARRLAGGAVVLCYHNVVTDHPPQPHDPALHMHVRTFEQQMAWVHQHLEPVTLTTLLQRLRDHASVRDLVAITFDDGYEGVFRAALPVLRTLGIPATVFVVADAAERRLPFWWDHPALVQRAAPERRTQWLTRGQGLRTPILTMEEVGEPEGLPPDLLPASWDMIRGSLGADLAIGAHTWSHASLPTLPDPALRDELVTCATRIEERLGTRPRWLAYPYGAWNAQVRAAAHAAGYEAALTLDSRRIGGDEGDLLALPRVNVPGRIPLAAFEAWASGLQPPGRSGR